MADYSFLFMNRLLEEVNDESKPVDSKNSNKLIDFFIKLTGTIKKISPTKIENPTNTSALRG